MRTTRVAKLAFFTVLLRAVALALPAQTLPSPADVSSLRGPKHIFIFLADGTGMTHLEISRMYNRQIHNRGLKITDRIFREGSLGLMTTHSADSLISDSAAAATALADGCKAKNGVVGICAEGRVPRSVLEVAKDRGMGIGLVTNSMVYDASPAAFAVHVRDRSLGDRIVEDYLKLKPDVLMGGGRDRFLPGSHPGGLRKDQKDMISAFKAAGYRYVSEKGELGKVGSKRLLGLFALREMSFDLDRNKEHEPGLFDMTQAALRLLTERSPGGFVLFVENENTDNAAHLSDVVSLIHEVREFDRAVGLAYDFYRLHPSDTLVLVTSDHETGGLAFTASARQSWLLGSVRRVLPSSDSLEKIATVKISVHRALGVLGPRPSSEDVDQLMQKYYSSFSLPPDLKETLLAAKSPGPTFYGNPRAAVLGAMIARNTHAYWLGRGHTNQPVFVGALGVGAERFRGYFDNTEFAKQLLDLIEKGGGR